MLRRQLYFFVELLDTAQEVLRNSTDMQACMNEAADLAALVAKLKEEHAKVLEERDKIHGAELSKLTEQIKILNEKNRDWRKLKRAVELKDGQIASLEEARKKDKGTLCFLLIRQVGSIFPVPPTPT